MNRIIALLFFSILLACSIAFGTEAPAPAIAAQSPSIMTWIMSNSAAIFGVCLAISEFMALIPGFQGNGILDAIIKALTVLSKKPE